jgi:hypothetical protein
MKALNRVIVLLAVVAAFSFVNRVQAAEDAPTWEVTGGTSASYVHTNITGAASGSHTWGLGTGLGYFFNNMYELGSTITFNAGSNNGLSTKSFGLKVGPTFNFMGTPENAMFVTGQIGILMNGNGSSPSAPNSTQLAYTLGVGRRVEIVKHVTWSPEVAIVGVAKNTDSTTGIVAPSTTQIQVIPFQFSLLF